MITYKEALQKVLATSLDYGNETVALMSSVGRVLAHDIVADRDFPPFNRATKDGIAIDFKAIGEGIGQFKIEAIASAGTPQLALSSYTRCIEVMTGAVLPKNTDTVIMYEQLTIKDGLASLQVIPAQHQNIHKQGSDEKTGNILIPKATRISPAVLGVLASVGASTVTVKKLPNICLVSTGNELIAVSKIPLAHQIRTSNILSLQAALGKEHIGASLLHLIDDKQRIAELLKKALQHYDVLLLSGGVSKGKFDFIPEVLESLGVEKLFHRVSQRPGKPFWFGRQREHKKTIFSFPGNPVSTFVNYHVYFLPWLAKSIGLVDKSRSVVLEETVRPHSTLALFLQVSVVCRSGNLYAKPLLGNGSGDLVSLAKADGFVYVPAGRSIVQKGDTLEYIPVT